MSEKNRITISGVAGIHEDRDYLVFGRNYSENIIYIEVPSSHGGCFNSTYNAYVIAIPVKNTSIKDSLQVDDYVFSYQNDKSNESYRILHKDLRPGENFHTCYLEVPEKDGGAPSDSYSGYPKEYPKTFIRMFSERILTRDNTKMMKQKFSVGEKVCINQRNRHYLMPVSIDTYFPVLSVRKNRDSNGVEVVDYFIKVDEALGGKYESRHGCHGLWYKEELLKSETESNKDFPKEGTMSSKSDSDMISYSPKDVRVYNAVLPPVAELAKQAVFYLLAIGLKAAKKSAKYIGSWITIADDFLKNNAKEADAIFKWVIGFLCKHAHKIRTLPGIKDVQWLNFLDNESVKKFGHYAEDASEGALLGDLLAKGVKFVQEKVMGIIDSSALLRIAEVMENPAELPRIAAETSALLRKNAEAEMEALAAEEKQAAVVAA